MKFRIAKIVTYIYVLCVLCVLDIIYYFIFQNLGSTSSEISGMYFVNVLFYLLSFCFCTYETALMHCVMLMFDIICKLNI